MEGKLLILTYFISFGATYTGILLFIRWSLRRNLFDVPNERSSHTVPTPRGGGLIIVIVCLTAYTVSTIFLKGSFSWCYLLGAFLVAAVSWLDDLYKVSVIWRFFIHALSASLVIYGLGYFDAMHIPPVGSFSVGAFGIILTFLWIVWLTNAYNFMDGIDGIAGIQSVTAGFGWYLAGNLLGLPNSGFYGGVIACASLGFLILNWQPAKIFMGDVGSAFLGYTFAVLPLLAKSELGTTSENDRILFPTALLLVWLFAFDTLWTFGRRVLNREKVWEAHRGHLYQKYVINGLSHGFVSGLYAIISICNVLAVILSLMYPGGASFILILVFLQSAGLILGLYFLKKR